ncbi:MAG: hypothetical protein IJG52_01640 [Lachnospiraceae bacterium]|nr:hypothetical protein [Lachnospiraceae bacterium]
MKKQIITVLFTLFCILLPACGAGTAQAAADPVQEETVQEEPEQEEPVREEEEADGQGISFADPALDFDGTGRAETKEGALILYGSTGSSADGGQVIVYADERTDSQSVRYALKEFDASLSTFLYINGKRYGKLKPGTEEGKIVLKGDMLLSGIYTAEAVQFEGDEENGTVRTLHRTDYEVVVK